ncbi:MAG TPA: hypothetical protein PLN52_15270 [Opitutaceae bacterium]|nr:hypothetical protein [Opitutaceae bacterium]
MSATLTSSQRTQIAIITVVAIAVYLGFRWLPTGTNLSHMDFRVSGGNSIEFCDPSNPQFIPVVAVRSPVIMAVESKQSALAGSLVDVSVRLKTSSGKPMSAEDLLVAHTRKLHLLIVDPSLHDYQHVHPEPTGGPGEWSFSFTPKAGGLYRVFADFTPVATGRGLYAHADLSVQGPVVPAEEAAFSYPWLEYRDTGYLFVLQAASDAAFRSGVPVDLIFQTIREDGGPVALEPVMDAFAHLVAFDLERGGFAHLHPAETDLTRPPDTQRPQLTFKITIPRPGRYVIWAQVSLEGRERFVPFWITVV